MSLSEKQQQLMNNAFWGQLAMVRQLCEQDGVSPHFHDASGKTPLHEACHAGNLDVARYLVEYQGVSIHATDNQGNTPLHLACYADRLDTVRYLVSGTPQGVFLLNVTNSQGLTPKAVTESEWGKAAVWDFLQTLPN